MASPIGAFLCPPGYRGPSGLRALAREGGAAVEMARLVRRTACDRLHRHDTASAPPSPGHATQPVVLVPGFMAGDATLSLMARHLRAQGFRTYRSTMRANVGCTREASQQLERRVEAVAIRRERRVAVVGHSLGGLLARALAARRPDLVSGIVTLGSPILAPGALHSLLALDLRLVTSLRRAGLGSFMGEECTSGDCARLSWEDARAPLDREVGFVSVFSRRDGMVDWRSCLDPSAVPVEVSTSHLGMVVDPSVHDVVSRCLGDMYAPPLSPVAPAAPGLEAVPDASAG